MQTVEEKIKELAIDMLEENKSKIKDEMCENYIRIINSAPKILEDFVEALVDSLTQESSSNEPD